MTSVFLSSRSSTRHIAASSPHRPLRPLLSGLALLVVGGCGDDSASSPTTAGQAGTGSVLAGAPPLDTTAGMSGVAGQTTAPLNAGAAGTPSDPSPPAAGAAGAPLAGSPAAGAPAAGTGAAEPGGAAGMAPVESAGAGPADNTGGTAGAAIDAAGAAGAPDNTAGMMTAGQGGAGLDDQGGAAGESPMDDPVDSGVCTGALGTAPTGQLQATLIDGVIPGDNNFHLYEGPVWIDGAIYFSDIDPNPWDSTIRRHVPGSNTATDFLVGAGTNGLAVDASGQLFSATARKKEISSYDLGTAAQTRVVGGTLNSPNDIAIASDGTIYFSDPQQGELPAGNQPQVVHVVKAGVDAIFDETITNPNGLTLSPEEDFLYISGGGFTGYLKKVALVDGLAGAAEDLATGLQVPDGMTKDCAGNLYVALHETGQVGVFSPDGTQIATIALGNAANGQTAKPTNLAFGGEDGKTLFITAIYSLWELPLSIAGYPY